MLLGSHLSIAGGIHNALIVAHRYGFDTVAVFVRNQRQWRTPPLTRRAAETFRRTRKKLRIGPVVAHGSYLINLAGSREVRGKSILAMREELNRCGRLGVQYLVIHPGSNEDPKAGIRLIADALNRVMDGCPHRRPKILLETTSGAGNSIGRSFRELAEILALLRRPRRFGVCLDTCHVFAAGYDVRTAIGYQHTMKELDRFIGLDRLRAIHLNDSLKGLGSRIDRHAHIGRGRIGLAGFANFVNDPRLSQVPMILETPKGKDDSGRDWDQINAEAIRSLVRGA